MVAEGFDLAIRAHAQPLKDSSLIQRPLATTPWMLFCSPSLDDPKAFRRPEELNGTSTLFTMHDGMPCEWTLQGFSLVQLA